MQMGPLKLTDSEMDIVLAAARPLAVTDRDAFLQEVAQRLASVSARGDGLVYQIVCEVQKRHFDPPLNEPGPQPRQFERQPRKAAG
jgi:hypothetical protein